MPWLLFFSALAIPTFYAVGFLVHPEANFTQNDFWRFWVVRELLRLRPPGTNEQIENIEQGSRSLSLD
jgi:hypothetical protein